MKSMRWFFPGLMMALLASVMMACSAQPNSLEVEMSEFGFTPTQMMVKAGAPVTIHLENNGALEHDFLILERGEQAHSPFKEEGAHIYWKARLNAHDEQILQFTAPAEPGEYQVVCGVAGHLEQKMQATLIVTP